MSEAMMLNLVLFLPLAGMLALIAVPASQPGTVRQMTLAVMLLQLALAAWLYVRFDAGAPGLQFETVLPWIADWGVYYRIGLDGYNLLLVLLTAFLGPLVVAGSFSAVSKDLKLFHCHGAAGPVRDDGHLRRAGPVRLLPVLGDDADPDVPVDRHLGRRSAHLRHAQVRALHRLRQHPDAGRGDLPRAVDPRRRRRGLVRLRRPAAGQAAAAGTDAAADRLWPLVRDQGADGAAAHLAARRPRRGADHRLGDPGRRDAEDGHLRLHEAGLPAVPRGHAVADAAADDAGRDQHHLRRGPGAGAGRHQEDHRLLVDQPPRLRHARPGQPGPARHPGRGDADGQPRPRRRRPVPDDRHDLRALPHARVWRPMVAWPSCCRCTRWPSCC